MTLLLSPLQAMVGGGYYGGESGYRGRPHLGYGPFAPGFGASLSPGLIFPGFGGVGYRGFRGIVRSLGYGRLPFIGAYGIGRGQGYGGGYLG